MGIRHNIRYHYRF